MSIDAYAAGVIDGEGCIYVVDSKPKKQGPRNFYPVVQVGMTEKALPVLRWLKSHYGGRIYKMREATETWDAAFNWHVYREPAAEMLRRLTPYLTLKDAQARMAIRVQEIRRSLIPPSKSSAVWTEDATERCLRIRKAIQELNRKGPRTPSRPPVNVPNAQPLAQLVGGEWVTFQTDLFSDTGWERFSGPWPRSGTGSPGGAWMLATSASPSDASECSLSAVLEATERVPLRFYLSQRGAAGVLRRAERRGRKLPRPLRIALEAVAAQSTDAASPLSAEGSAQTTTSG